MTSRRLAKLLERQERHGCLQTYVSIALASTDDVVEDAKSTAIGRREAPLSPPAPSWHLLGMFSGQLPTILFHSFLTLTPVM